MYSFIDVKITCVCVCVCVCVCECVCMNKKNIKACGEENEVEVIKMIF